MAMSNAELTDEVRDLKGRVRELEEFRATILWERALEEADLQAPTAPEVAPEAAPEVNA